MSEYIYKGKKNYTVNIHVLPPKLKNTETALAGVAQWIECQPANQKVTGSVPSQGTCLGCRPGPY